MNSSKPQVRDLFVVAMKLAPDQWDDYLDRQCGDDTALRIRAGQLLRAHAGAGDFLEHPAVAVPTEPLIAEGPGTVIGPYKLLEQIGEGGMGLVFLAEQTQPVRRKVALKVLKPGMDTRQVVARFEAERQALALMDHPNIARIIDGGAVGNADEPEASARVTGKPLAHASGSSGRPYFVMELVRGLPITDYCDQARLSLRDRLALFATVCHAVQHAHQKGIIHRDLKPSNVMVTVVDGRPVPKVIDFGIAKAVGGGLTDRTLHTGFQQMVGTPMYMSPEQAELSGVDVDTRSDVYALGVLLYELLTGATPFDSETLKKVGLDEVRRLIREADPPTPSRRVGTLEGAALTTDSDRRGVDGRQFSRILRSELDWVVMKALEKDRTRRYESASALAADVERFLANEPVEACPPSAWYRLRKYVRRNRAASTVALTLVATTGVSAWLAVKAVTAERKATTEAAVARAVSEFLQSDLLGQADAAVPPGRDYVGKPYLTVKEALDQAAARIGDRFQDQPVVEAAIRTTIGHAYKRLHENEAAVVHLERAVTLRRAHLGPDHPDTLHSMTILTTAYGWVGRYPDAIALCQEMLDRRRATLGDDCPKTLRCVFNLANAYGYAGQFDSALRLLEPLVERRRVACGATHPDTLGTLHLLAVYYAEVNRLDESLAAHERQLELRRSVADPDGGDTPWYLRTFAQACQRAGELDRADRLLRESLELERKRPVSPQRQGLANTLGWLAVNRLLQNRPDEAEPLAREAVATEQGEDFKRSYWISVLGAALLEQEKYSEAGPLLERGYEGLTRSVPGGTDKRRLAEVRAWLVRFYEETDQPEKADAVREHVPAADRRGAQER